MKFLPILLLLASAFGQMNTGEVSGQVTDISGAAMPGATVVAEQSQTGQKFQTVSNAAGQYLFPQLPIGSYSLRAAAQSFKQSTIPSITVHIGETLRYNFTLQVGDANEAVVVEADPGEVQLQTAEIKDVFPPRDVVGLPLKGRQIGRAHV